MSEQEIKLLEITNVVIYPFESEDKQRSRSRVLAYADLTFNQQLTLKGFKIIRTDAGGLFVGYPSQRGRSGKYFDLILPLFADLKKQIREQIIAAFKDSTV